MDRYNDHVGYDRTEKEPANAFQGGSAFETAPLEAPRLQKQKSRRGMKSASHVQPLPATAVIRSNAQQDVGGFGDGAKARKGSIRNAVRKIFGRRSRDVGFQGSDAFAPAVAASRHTYHKSEPTNLPPPREDAESLYRQDEEYRQRALSGPYEVPAQAFSRTASPYAVQFPNSVRLKPMDLGNPFMGPPNQLRRRKTLPSIILDEQQAAVLARQSLGQDRQTAHSEQQNEMSTSVPKRVLGSIRRSRRKSRSADDLKSSATNVTDAPRKRSEEIRYWRESYQPDVLRASGFVTRQPRQEEEIDAQASGFHFGDLKQIGPEQQEQGTQEQTPPRHAPEPAPPSVAGSGARTFKSTPPRARGHGQSLSESDMRPPSGVGTEMSRDLEDRVAKLEAGLQNFQLSLQRLTAERNRRTIIMGSVNTRSSTSDMRTPSLLADTLADPLEPSSYEYEYEQTALRPSKSPGPPDAFPQQAAEGLEDPFGPTKPQTQAPERPRETQKVPNALRSHPPSQHGQPPEPLQVPTSERPPESFKMPSPLQSHPPAQQPPAPAPAPASTSAKGQPQPYTFSSLYQMLADERSARRKLESQLRGLRQEISDLHTQVTASSNAYSSTRSSYMLSGGSSKLQELLRETEEGSSPTNTAPQSPQRDSGLSATLGGAAAGTQQQQQQQQQQAFISRFSGSESDAFGGGNGGDTDELTTPQEGYQTPLEEKSFHFAAPQGQSIAVSNQGLMF